MPVHLHLPTSGTPAARTCWREFLQVGVAGETRPFFGSRDLRLCAGDNLDEGGSPARGAGRRAGNSSRRDMSCGETSGDQHC
jgi:hypothetical protein